MVKGLTLRLKVNFVKLIYHGFFLLVLNAWLNFSLKRQQLRRTVKRYWYWQLRISILSIPLRDEHIWRPWKLSNFQDPPTTLSIYVQNSSTPLTLDVQFQTTPPLQMITNQLKENIIQDWLLYVIRSFFQVGFRFQYQLINLVWLSFDFFSFSWSLTICFFVALYSSVCSCLEISRNVF